MVAMVNHRVPLPSGLAIASLGYLLLPNLFFAGGYLNTPWALLLAAALLLAFFQDARWLRSNGSASIRPGVAVIVVVLVWVALSGAGAIGYQNEDHVKHNGVLKTLWERPWPPAFSDCGQAADCTMVYYTAFYLPAAAAGKLLGWQAANIALNLWTAAGALLAALWMQTFTRTRRLWPVWFFIFAGGWDLVGYIAGSRTVPPFTEALEQWPNLYTQFNSPTFSLVWVPQHALPAWLATALIYARAESAGSSRGLILLGACVFLWSPLITIGLLPLMAFAVFRTRARGLFTATELLAAAVAAAMLVPYFMSSALKATQGPLWHFVGVRRVLALPLLVLPLELGPLAALFFLRKTRPAAADSRWFLLALAVCCALPWYVFGYYGDLCMRGSTPAIFLMVVLVASALPDWMTTPRHRAALFAVLLIASASSVHEMARSVTRYSWRAPAPSAIPTPILLEPRDRIGSQYLGRADSFFVRYLARPLDTTAPLE
jgi:hypothetical protein